MKIGLPKYHTVDDSGHFVKGTGFLEGKFVKDDIKFWFPKLKKGGILSGHDYLDIDWYNQPIFHPSGKDHYIYTANGFYNGVFGVNPAVDEFCTENNYEVKITSDDDFFQSWWIIK